MDIVTFLRLVDDMRTAQRIYLKYKKPKDLLTAIRLEFQVDEALKDDNWYLNPNKVFRVTYSDQTN